VVSPSGDRFATDESDEPVLELRVLHGSLEEASEPVAVGHYQGMPLEGAEGFLDSCLGHKLADRLQLGVYPDQEAGAVFVPGGPTGLPPGGLVLGLGPAGEVTALKVTRSMTEASVLRALAALEYAGDAGGSRPDDSGPRVVGVSAVLVGANPLDGMSVEASLRALVEGFVTAALLIQSNPHLSSRVCLGTLEIVERWADRAEVAQGALAAVAARAVPSGSGLRMHAASVIDKRKSGVAGQPAGEYAKQFWWRIDIRSAPGPTDAPSGYRDVEFTSIARRARADRLLQRLEEPTVDGLVAEAVQVIQPDPEICHTLYELLLPNEVKADLFGADNLQLLLDRDAAALPWEALAARGAGDDDLDWLAYRAGMLRQFAEPETRNARFSVRRPFGRQALVIGNPPGGDGYSDLPAARVEAEQVAACLGADGAGYQVRSLIWGDAGVKATGLPMPGGRAWSDVVKALYRYEYRIIHIAAHGAFNLNDPAHSGVVIGPGHCMTAQTVRQLPTVPELVFLNCCHTGGLGGGSQAGGVPDVNRLAASIARGLIGIGVRAVVAAGWAVADDAATLFSTTLYDQLLVKSVGFGKAVHEARRMVKDQAGSSMTWAAYQCYGDPEFRLRLPADD
jgi:hypothetical protein